MADTFFVESRIGLAKLVYTAFVVSSGMSCFSKQKSGGSRQNVFYNSTTITSISCRYLCRDGNVGADHVSRVSRVTPRYRAVSTHCIDSPKCWISLVFGLVS
jgi:hypothetical protein